MIVLILGMIIFSLSFNLVYGLDDVFLSLKETFYLSSSEFDSYPSETIRIENPNTLIKWLFDFDGVVGNNWGFSICNPDGSVIFSTKNNHTKVDNNDAKGAQPFLISKSGTYILKLSGGTQPNASKRRVDIGSAQGKVWFEKQVEGITYMVRCMTNNFEHGGRAAVHNYFDFYLPADPSNRTFEQTEVLGTGNHKTVNLDPLKIKIFDYPTRIRYTFQYCSAQTYWSPPGPVFSFYKCNSNTMVVGQLGSVSYSTSGVIDASKGYGIKVSMDNGHRQGPFGEDLGGYRGWYQLNYRLDEVPPDAPEINTENLQAVYRNGVYYTKYQTLNISWNEANDHGTWFEGFENISGVDKYIVEVITDPNSNKIDYDYIVGREKHNEDVVLRAKSTKYHIRLWAKDLEKNKSIPIREVIVVYDDTAPSIIGNPKANGLDTGQYTQSTNLVWQWNPATSESNDSGFKEYQYRIYKEGTILQDNQGWTATNDAHTIQNDVTDGKYYCQVRALDYAGNFSDIKTGNIIVDTSVDPVAVDSFQMNGSSGVLTWNLGTDLTNIIRYDTVITQEPTPPGVNVKFDSVRASDATGNQLKHKFYGLSSTKTYYVWVRAWDGVGNSSNWNRVGPVPNFTFNGPYNKLLSNSLQQTFDVQPRPPAEGKEIRYRVCYEGPGVSKLDGPFQQNSQQLEFPSDGKWNWWLEIQEFAGEIPVGPLQKTETFILSIDTISPGGMFSFQAKDGVTDLTKVPSSTENIRIIPDKLNDNSGTVCSGVKGFYLWNGDSNTRPAEALFISDLYAPVQWTLPMGDGSKQVNMMIVDNAGNETLVTRSVGLDTTPPVMPANLTHTHLVAEDGIQRIKFDWSSPSTDIAKFTGSLVLPDGVYIDLPNLGENSTTGTYSLGVSAFSPNKPVVLTVQAIDKAGNLSEPATYAVYTLATCGILGEPASGYNPTDGHYFTSALSGGKASRQVLELCTSNEFAGNVLAFENHNGQCKATQLQAHQTYYYRLAAYNTASTVNGAAQNDADKTIGAIGGPYTVPCSPPGTFDITTLMPNGFATTTGGINEDNVTVQFVFGTVSSVDNDQISYQVLWAAGVNPDPAGFQNADGNQTEGFSLTLPKAAAQGQTYTWFVRATASYDNQVTGTVDSPPVHFTVDANPPQIDQLVRPAGEYTNQDSVTITVHDDLSGIAKVTCKKTGDTSQTAIRLAPPADNSPTGQWTGQIPLPEGEYNLEVYVYDNAGNIRTDGTSLYNLKVDRTSQSPTGVQILLNTKDGQYVSAGTVPVIWTVSENGIQGVYYWLVKQLPANLNELPLSTENYIINQSATIMNATLPLSGETGDTFYLVMAAKDQAGNLSSKYISASKILLDKTPPAISDLAVSGFVRGGCSLYLANPNSLVLDHFQVAEDVSEVTSRKYGLVDTTNGQEQIILSWTSNWAGIQGIPFVNGHTYRIKAQAVNTPGLTSDTSTSEFVFDNSAPGNIQMIGPTGTLMSGETVIFTVSATGTHSPITGYYLGIGSENGGTDLTSLVPGNQNGWVVLSTNNTNGIIRIELPKVGNGTYFPVLKVRNAAGIESAVVSGSQFTINNNQNKMIVHDQGPYTSRSDQLTGWWENYPNATSYKYRILGPNQTEVYSWHTIQGNQVSVREPGLTFNSGTQYQFEVKAIFDGGESASGFSPGVTVDTSVPEITQLTVDNYSTSYHVKLTWNGRDNESGIARIQVAVGTYPNQSDISFGYLDVIGNTAWISCDTYGRGLQFVNNTRYYLTLRLVNGAGLAVEQPSSCVIIDDTVPPVPVVVDQGKYINTNTSQPMEAQWIWSRNDPESGNVKYEWAIVESSDQLEQAIWHDVGAQTQVSLTMNDFARVDTKQYYFAVRVTNGSGLTSMGLSDGILVDGQAPLIPKVKLLQGTNLDPSTASEVNYISNLNNLSLAINSWAASNITQVQYTWGTIGEVDGKPLQSQDTTTNTTVVTLNDGTVTALHTSDFIEYGPYTIVNNKRLYFLAKAISGAGNPSAGGYSAGVILETGAPAITGVNSYRSGNQFLFNWNVNTDNSISPLDHYEVALVASADLNGDPSQWTWNSTGQARKYQIALQDLPEGQYYLVIRGVNRANIASRRELNEWAISHLIVVDNTPPVISRFEYPLIVANQLPFHVEAADEGTGIGGYQYAIGTLADGQSYSNGWVDINCQDGALSGTIDTTRIPTNRLIYFTLRVKDGAGNWTLPGNTSQAILVDHTPPSTPVVNCNSFTKTSEFISGISFESSDLESQVTQYRIGIVTSPDSPLDETLPIRSLQDFDGKCIPGFILAEGSRYYIAVQTLNGAGLASATGYSGPVTVDTNPPLLTFANAYETMVVNPVAESEPAVNIGYWLSENANILLHQTASDGTFKNFNISGTAGLNNYAFKESKPQAYTITVIPMDLAGNTGNTKSQNIRVNARPDIIIAAQFFATPSQPLNIPATIIDTDGMAGDTIQYNLDPGDGTGNIYGTALLSTLTDGTVGCVINVTHSYQNVTLENQAYQLKLTAIDKDGGIAVVDDTAVKIGNTQSGTLSGDEIWSGEHHLFGTVIVPANIHLTIMPNTRVIIDGTPGIDGYDIALIVYGTLTVGNNASFDSKDGVLQNGVVSNRWKGIRIEGGQASLDGAIIKHAYRGISVKTGNTVNLTHCTLAENLVGIHVYQSSPTIQNCHFTQNQWYGIKEDLNAHPAVTGCGFGGNEVDYYRDRVTEITIEDLNQISGNTGNYLE
jgi:hypothetical protein